MRYADDEAKRCLIFLNRDRFRDVFEFIEYLRYHLGQPHRGWAVIQSLTDRLNLAYLELQEQEVPDTDVDTEIDEPEGQDSDCEIITEDEYMARIMHRDLNRCKRDEVDDDWDPANPDDIF